MRKLLIVLIVLPVLMMSGFANGLEAPEVPAKSEAWMPHTAGSFTDGLLELLENVIKTIRPDIRDAINIGVLLIGTAAVLSIIASTDEKVNPICDLTASLTVGTVMFQNSHALIRLAAEIITDLSEYGKLFIPVMSAALAAQGGIVSSSALYFGTVSFSSVLCNLISRILVPMVYLFLAVSCAYGAMGEETLKKLKEQIKKMIHWMLKTILTFFISFMSITGVVNGTVDSVKVKAAKTAISTAVPVIGGTLADASESILVGAALVKNAAGIYGIYAMLAIFLAPFFRIGAHYLVLKWTSVLCSLFDSKRCAELIEDFSSAMGFLLAMTGSICVLLQISTICFIKGGV